MGRHAGWIAAAAGLAAQKAGDPPHIILLPEVAFQRERFLARVRETVERTGYCVVVASEGASDASGELIAASAHTDAFGHKQLGGIAPTIAEMIKAELGYKYHWALADYLQRAARHIASATDVEQAYAVGRAAVEYALEGKNAVMVTIERQQGGDYAWSLGEAPLDQVANVEKKMPGDFITEDGFGITAKARAYLEPLIQGEDYPPYRNGTPAYTKIRGEMVAKKLALGFTA
jgi:6-phosphofructokinase 1